MAQTYTRQSSIADGDTITAALFNNEYNQLLNAFAYSSSSASSTGHRHDGSTAQGGNIHTIGDLDFLNKIVVDSTNNRWGVFVEVSSAAVEQVRISDGVVSPVTDSDVDLGTSSLYFKNAYIDAITTTGNVAVGGNLTVTGTTAFNGGTLTLGDSASDNVVFGADINSNMIPNTDSAYDLGSSSQEWRDLYLDGTAHIDTLDVDVNATVAGTLGVTGIATFTDDIIIGDGKTIGSASDVDAITIAANGQLTLTQTLIGTALDISGDIDIDGTTNLDVVDIDGAVDMATTLTVGGEITAASLDISGNVDIDGTLETDALSLNGTTVTATATDINLIDGITNGTVIASKAIVTDANIDITGGRNITISGELDAATLDISGDADIDGTLEADAITIGGVTLAETISDTVGAMVTSNTESGITVAYQDADNTLDFTIGTLNQDTTGTAAIATTVTITDNESTNENNAIVFTAGGDLDGGNLGLESDGDLKYNPSTGTLSATNISVSGTFSTVNSVTMNANNAVVFEGSTADAHETTLSSIDATGDRTINLPNVSGTLPVLARASATQISSTPEELNILDGATVVVGEINALDIGSTAIGTAVASKAVILDSNKDYTGIRNLTITGELDGATLDISGDADIDGTTNLDVVDIDGAVDMASTLVVASTINTVGITGPKTNFVGSMLISNDAGTGTLDAASNNTGFGNEAFDDLTSGDNNTGVGAQALAKLTTGSNNTAMGNNSLDANTTGSSNTGLGALSLSGNTTAANNVAVGRSALQTNSTGASNTAIGKDAMLANTTGNENVGIGLDALTANTTGDNNIGIGAYALLANTTAGNNIGIGFEALKTVTTGTANVAVGFQALKTNAADDNTAVGNEALEANTTGNNNVAVGSDALGANTTAANNTAVGAGALKLNTTGANNTSVGNNSLDANTTASNNTAVGYRALSAATTGDTNVAVGKDAMLSTTTGTNNVAVGATSLDANTTGTNNTALGDGALGANTTGNSSTAVGAGAGLTSTSYDATYVGYNAGTNANVAGVTLVGAYSGDAITTGAGNTALGYYSLSATTTGANNTAVGQSALLSNTTGAGCTAVGKESLELHTTGTNNTAIGFQSLEAVTTGQHNSAIGKGAGGAKTTGNESVFLGYLAGNYNVGQATGQGNICLGAYSHTSATGGNYAIAIGYNVSGEAGYTTLGSGGDDIRTNHGGVNWATVSDERVKKDIEDATVGLAFINDLRPVTFNYKHKGDIPENFRGYEEGSTEAYRNSKSQHGFIAQEVKAAIDKHSDIKDGFSMWDDDDPTSQQRVGETAVIPILVKAVQELSAEIEELKTQPKCKCNEE